MIGCPYALARNVVVAASAGTGKTHALVGVVLNLLLGATADERGRPRAPVTADRIVATTFSRKAAAEMRARVAAMLELMSDPGAKCVYDAWIAEALASMGQPAFLPHERAERARAALSRLDLRVMTLHAFALTIVRGYALEAGFAPGVEVLAEAEDRRIAERAIEAAIGAWLDTHGDDARAIFDAAGSYAGLVDMVRGLLARVSESGAGAGALAIDETEVERSEHSMQEVVRLASRLASEDSACEAASALTLAACGTDEATLALAAESFLAMDYRKRTDAGEALRTFRGMLDGATNADRGAELSRVYARRHEIVRIVKASRALLVAAENAIRAEKKRQNVLGFSDVLAGARDVLLHHADARKEIARGIDTLLVDEVQDTSRLQRDIIVLLRHVDPKSKSVEMKDVAPRGLFVVGDRKQSIYGFRGADVSVFAEIAVGLAGKAAQDALGIPDGLVWRPETPRAELVSLRENRRGAPALLDFANEMSRRTFSPEAEPPATFEIRYVPATEDLITPRDRATGDASRDHARTTWVRPPVTGSQSTRMDDAIACASIIAREMAEAVPLHKTGAAPHWKDFAILALTNETLEKAAYALSLRGIPYVVAGRGFYRAREVGDVALLLDLLLDPGDRHAMAGVLRGPCCGARDETVIALTDPRWGLRRVDAHWLAGPRRALMLEEDRARVTLLRDVVVRLSRVVLALGPGRALREAVSALDLEETLALLPRGAERIANVRKLIALADAEPDARAFAKDLGEAMERELAESEAATFSEDDDAVRLLTVHASKGLDFPIVLVPEAGAVQVPRVQGVMQVVASDDDGAPRFSSRFFDLPRNRVLSPPSYARAKAAIVRRERAERQRLVYVAMTRASDRMFFVGARRPPKTGLREDTSMSVALASIAEARPDLLRVRDETPVLEAIAAPAVAPATARDDLTPRTPLASSVLPPIPAELRPSPPRARVRSLTIAPTALSDFAHCARRFHLVHDVGLPEFRARAGDREEAAPPAAIDARREGTLLHAVLERVGADAFGASAPVVEEAVRAEIARLGVAESAPHHELLRTRAARFLGSMYAAHIRERGATLERELPFLVEAHATDPSRPSVLLRGTMDLVVRFPDGAVHVIDYKRARGPDPAPYGFQLDVYALAASRAFGVVPKTGIVFLGGRSAEPIFREPRAPDVTEAHLAALGADLVLARWSETFPRVEIEKCHEIVCGYVGRCHPEGDS